jgi:hypothetical protein
MPGREENGIGFVIFRRALVCEEGEEQCCEQEKPG